VASGKRRAPILKHSLETSLSEMRLRRVLPCVGQAETGQRRIEHPLRTCWPSTRTPQFAAAFFELPSVQPPRRQAQIDAVVVGEVLRLLGGGRFAKYDGAPTTSIRMSGPIRTAIMSFATCSPDLTPASSTQSCQGLPASFIQGE
jgi:hypothetical protein